MRMAASVTLVLGSVALVGCGRSSIETNKVGDDRTQLATLLTEFADTGSATTMKPYFAVGSKVSPAEHKKYVALVFEFDGKPEVNGNTATGTVKMRTSSDGKEMGSKEWTFVKEGDKWKIKSALLP